MCLLVCDEDSGKSKGGVQRLYERYVITNENRYGLWGQVIFVSVPADCSAKESYSPFANMSVSPPV